MRRMHLTHDAYGLITHWPAQTTPPTAYESNPGHRQFGWEHWAIVVCVIGAALALIGAVVS